MIYTIMIIEDNLQIDSLEQEILEGSGYASIRAYSGTEALPVVEKTVPDLILPSGLYRV